MTAAFFEQAHYFRRFVCLIRIEAVKVGGDVSVDVLDVVGWFHVV
jgi:hypothetical protein